MTDVLANKREATRFRILAEIADRQPAVSQGEIAEAVGVTSQAVSEYIRELVEDGYMDKEGRSRYRVTKQGVDWLFGEATQMRRFADHVTEDVLGGVNEDAAIARAGIAEGETVSLTMDGGLLYAEAGEAGPATGVATTDADAGEVVGVSGFEGVIDVDPTTVTVHQVPPVRAGSVTDDEEVATACADAEVVTAAGLEAVVALREADVTPETQFAPGEVAADAASRGLTVTVVATTDSVGWVTDALREAGVEYEVTT
jgi:putative transcriptional regulator